jgi:hypothetical protein
MGKEGRGQIMGVLLDVEYLRLVDFIMREEQEGGYPFDEVCAECFAVLGEDSKDDLMGDGVTTGDGVLRVVLGVRQECLVVGVIGPATAPRVGVM